MNRVILILLISIFAFSSVAAASNRREKLERQATKLEAEVGSLESLIHKKEEILYKYENDQDLRKSFVENNIDPEDKVADVKKELTALHSKLDEKKHELDKLYEELKPETSPSDTRRPASQQAARIKYDFKQ